LKTHVIEVDCLCLGLNEVQDGLEALVGLEVLESSDVVVAAGKGGIDGNSLRFSIDFELYSSDTIKSTNSIDFRPN
jgi:hypothetical protein